LAGKAPVKTTTAFSAFCLLADETKGRDWVVYFRLSGKAVSEKEATAFLRGEKKNGVKLLEFALCPPDGKIERFRENIAWGQAVNGLRVGLSPEKIVVGSKETTLIVRLCYENTGKEPRKIPVHGRYVNCFRIMFAAEKDGKTSYAYWNGKRSETSWAVEKEIGAGERFEENFLLMLPFNAKASETKKAESQFNLPELKAAESLKVTFGLCVKTDPGETSWALADTAKSGTITVTRAAQEAAPEPGKGVDALKDE
jgi:hypothetical protein